jgi:Domain of unknown function (DUF4124)
MLRFLPLLLLLLVPPSFAEVYRWVDSNGRVQYSDHAPPDIDAKTVGAKPATGSDSGAAAKSYVDKEQDFRKRQVENAEKAKKQAALDDESKAKQQNCTQARTQLATAQAGGRIARLNEKGQREYLDDNAIATERVKGQESVAKWCS